MKIQVIRYEDVRVNGNKFVAYITSVDHAATGLKWEIPIRYSLYHEFYTKISKTDSKVNGLTFPQKTFFAPSCATRRDQLDKFVTQLTAMYSQLSTGGKKLLDDLLQVDINLKAHAKTQTEVLSTSEPVVEPEAQNAIVPTAPTQIVESVVLSNEVTNDIETKKSQVVEVVPVVANHETIVESNTSTDLETAETEETRTNPQIQSGEAEHDEVRSTDTNVIINAPLTGDEGGSIEHATEGALETIETAVVSVSPAPVESTPVTVPEEVSIDVVQVSEAPVHVTPVAVCPIPVVPVAVNHVHVPPENVAPVVVSPVVVAPVDVSPVVVAPVAVQPVVSPSVLEEQAKVKAARATLSLISSVCKKVEAPVDVQVQRPNLLSMDSDDIYSSSNDERSRPALGSMSSVEFSTTDDENYGKKPLTDEQRRRRNKKRAQKRRSRKAAGDAATTDCQSNMTNRLQGFDKPTVWHEFTPLSIKHSSINLGQGFPDWQCDDFVKEAAKSAIDADFNQYARPGGHLGLVRQVAKKYTKEFNRTTPIVPETEIAIGVGASEIMYSAMVGLVNPGDEVILMEPAFDIYAAQVQMAGGVCKFVPLRFNTVTSQFEMDISALEAAFNDKTRVIVVNSPHNPTGAVFPKQDLEQLAAVVRRFPKVVVVADDVYEHIVFVPVTRFATLPGMWERTVTVASAGKTFSVTGWKVGWAVGPADLIKSLNLANNWVMFCVATPLQEAVATMLEKAEEPFGTFQTYYEYLQDRYLKKRDQLATALTSLGIPVILAQGGTFLFADVSRVDIPTPYLETGASRDYAFCRWLTIEKQVTAIPTSAFYSDINKANGHKYARFAYCKSDESLATAIERMQTIQLE